MESEFKCFLLSCCGKRSAIFLNAGAIINKLQARAAFGRPPKHSKIKS